MGETNRGPGALADHGEEALAIEGPQRPGWRQLLEGGGTEGFGGGQDLEEVALGGLEAPQPILDELTKAAAGSDRCRPTPDSVAVRQPARRQPELHQLTEKEQVAPDRG